MSALTHTSCALVFAALALLAASCASRDPEPVDEPPRLEPTIAETAPPPLSTERSGMSIAKATASDEPPAATARPEVWTRCSSNPDCVLSRVDPETCCETCASTAVTRAQQEELTARCGEASKPRSCPKVDCKSSPPSAARCDDHTCVVGRVALPRS